MDAEESEERLDSNASGSQPTVDSDSDDCDSVPPSPEIGMARAGCDHIQALDMEAGDDGDVAGVDSLTPPDFFKQHDLDEHDEDRMDSQLELQQPAATSARTASSERADMQPARIEVTCPPIRNSARVRGTLVYDQKYHPMDDFIRPSQAAKRRSIHGERPEDVDKKSLEESGSNCEELFHDTDDDSEDVHKPTRSRKRKRCPSRAPEPTRRSSRRKTKPKVAYDMRIHPQDSDLKRACAYDGPNGSPSPSKQVSRRIARSLSAEDSPNPFLKAPQSLPELTSEGSPLEPTLKPELDSLSQKVSDENLTMKRGVKLSDIIPDLNPDVAYLAGNKKSWPDVKGLPFSVYTERIEDQLKAEAEAASPFHYDDDDKENGVVNPELIPIPNPLDGISIIPASYYRRPTTTHHIQAHSSMAGNAFYSHPQFEALPYGLGWSDGDHVTDSGDMRECPFSDYMRILVSGESLPRSSTPAEVPLQEKDAFVSSSPLRSFTGLDLRR